MIKNVAVIACCLLFLYMQCWAMGESPQADISNPLFIIGLEATPNNFIVDDSLNTNLWPLCDKHAYNCIYLDAQESITSDQKALSTLIARAHSEEIKVILICGHPEWAYKHIHPLQTATQYLSYNEGHPINEAFDGIMFHIRLDLVENWQQDQEVILKKYFDMIKKIKLRLAYSGKKIPLLITLSADIHNQYKNTDYAKPVDGVIINDNSYPFLTILEDLTLDTEQKTLPEKI
ncbi:MAG: hypothetical protein ABIH39_04440 [Candidatus Margulisiibacteriota bacterium]